MFNMLFYDLIKSIGSDDNLKNKVVDLKPLFKVMFEQGFISGSKDGVEKYIESKEFKIDWSQAPDGANWWAMDESGRSYWFAYEPYISSEYPDEWIFHGKNHGGIGNEYWKSPNFNYQGDWKDSLRKRP